MNAVHGSQRTSTYVTYPNIKTLHQMWPGRGFRVACLIELGFPYCHISLRFPWLRVSTPYRLCLLCTPSSENVDNHKKLPATRTVYRLKRLAKKPFEFSFGSSLSDHAFHDTVTKRFY